MACGAADDINTKRPRAKSGQLAAVFCVARSTHALQTCHWSHRQWTGAVVFWSTADFESMSVGHVVAEGQLSESCPRKKILCDLSSHGLDAARLPTRVATCPCEALSSSNGGINATFRVHNVFPGAKTGIGQSTTSASSVLMMTSIPSGRRPWAWRSAKARCICSPRTPFVSPLYP